MSPPPFPSKPDTDDKGRSDSGNSSHSDANQEDDYAGEIDDMMDSEWYAGPAHPEKTVKPLTPEALAAFNTAQARSGVIYISRIPPGMQPAKVRHLLSQNGEVGRVYLQQEGEMVKPCPQDVR
jgi:ESF2/ABP1 family protein